MHNFVTKNFLPLSLAIILFTLLILVLPGIFNNTDIRKRAASASANFQIYPVNTVFQTGETKTFQVKATFSNPSPSETIDYLKMTISFPLDYFKVPDNSYVTLTFNGQKNLDRIFRVDGPVVSNQSGKIIVEVGAATPGSGPSTSGPVTFASFNLTATKNSPTSLPITVEVNQVVDSNSIILSTTTTLATVQVGNNITPNPTQVLPTTPPCNNSKGDANCDGAVNAADFDIWFREFLGQINTVRSDFNSSGKIDLVDLEIWRRNATSY